MFIFGKHMQFKINIKTEEMLCDYSLKIIVIIFVVVVIRTFY